MDTALLVIGSGPAGVAAAEAYRDHGGAGRVVVVTPEDHQPYFRPPLSKDFLRGESDLPDIALRSDTFYEDNDVEVHTGVEIVRLRPADREAESRAGDVIRYENAVIAAGASPLPLPAEGGETVPTLRSVADSDALRRWAARASSALVIGGGFIGCEAAASLAARGVTTSLVGPDRVPQHRRLGPDAGARLAEILVDAGVRYAGGTHVVSVSGRIGDGMAAELDTGVTVDVDLIVSATGISPRSRLADVAGLSMRSGRIAVDASMRTSAPHLFAAGDVASAMNATAGRVIPTEHWQDAEDQGRIAGAAAAGTAARWDAVPGFWTQIGDETVKYSAWGDGFASTIPVVHDDGGLTVWYADDAGRAVGVLTHDHDDDYARGSDLVARGAPIPVASSA